MLIPTQTGPDVAPYTIRITLDGAAFDLAFRWSERGATWLLDVSDADGNALVRGVAIVNGVDLLEPFNDPDLPPGALFVLPSSDPGRNAGQEELGGRVQLHYVPVAAMNSWAVEQGVA